MNTPSAVANARITTLHDTENCSDYLLVCEATATSLSEGTWRFSLESSDGQPVFDAGDTELGDLNRLTLLAAVRGLEAIAACQGRVEKYDDDRINLLQTLGRSVIELGHEDGTIRLCYGLRMEECFSKTSEASWQSHVGSAVCL